MKSYYIIALIKKVLVILCGLVSASIAARYLGPELRGDYGVIIAWSSIWVVIFNFGLNYTYQSIAKKSKQEERQSLIVSFVIFGGVAAGSLIIMGFIIGLILGTSSLVFLSTVVGVFSLLRMHILFIALIEHFKTAAVISIVQSSIEVVLLFVVFNFFSPSVLNVCVIFIVKEFVGIVSGLLILRPNVFSAKVKLLSINFRSIKVQYFFTLINIVILKMTLIIFSLAMDGGASVGILAIAILISEYFWIISDISKDVLTKISVDTGDPNVIAKSLRITLFLCLCAFAVYLIFGKFFIHVLFGDEYIESYAQSLILILGTVSLVSYKLISVWNISEGKLASNNKFTFWVTMCCIPIMFSLAHIVGVWGVVWSATFLYCIIGLFAGIEFSKSYSIPIKDIFVVRVSDLRELKRNVF